MGRRRPGRGSIAHGAAGGARRALATLLLVSLAIASLDGRPASARTTRDLAEASLEELMSITVTSVSRRPEARTAAASAIYVITSEDIRRSGATSIPEALRLAPGVHVARINSSQWVVGIRGSTAGLNRLSRAVLVLIDGRSVYSTLFAGVFWEVQDTLLEDVERIEVIRGPGATLWGANAFAGVVNIITKRASETQGGFVAAGGGTEERAFGGVRFGGAAGDGLAYRVYAKGFDRDGAATRGSEAVDDWYMGQVGFRMDRDRGGPDTFTVQGDLYVGEAGERTLIATYPPPFQETVDDHTDLSGGNLLGRWRRAIGDRSDTSLQLYYDRANRYQPNFREQRDTFDLDFQHHFVARSHEVVWGVGYRLVSSAADGVETVVFEPARRTDHLVSAFLQDEITLVPDRLRVTLGSKVEHNAYSGVEVQPSARLLWTPAGGQAVWASVARAVRTPSRLEHDLVLTTNAAPGTPLFARFSGEGFEPETLVAYELGYRVEPSPRLFVDVAAFYNDYSDLQSVEPGAPFAESEPAPPHTVLPIVFDNRMDGEAYGAEVAVDWRPFRWWRLAGAYAYLQIDLTADPGSSDPVTETSTEGSSPRHEVSVRSFLDLTRRLELNGVVRYVGPLRDADVGSYVGLDAGVTWRPTDALELTVFGQNLVEARHQEFQVGQTVTEIERAVYGKVTWRW